MKTFKTDYSRFWMGDMYGSSFKKGKSVDVLKLASIKRAIGNFVRIVTNKNIPVEYAEDDTSCTDGQRVWISGAVDKDYNFDAAVGLALHEGSHIKLSDFWLLRNLENEIPKTLYKKIQTKYGIKPEEAKQYCLHLIKDLVNIIEDRRIDNFIYTTAAGYRGYYEALYDKYFHSTQVDKVLQTRIKNNENWMDYMFHLINLTNPNRTLDILKALKPAADIIDLNNIDRLTCTKEVFVEALKVFNTIEDVLPKEQYEEMKKQAEAEGKGEGKGQGKGQGKEGEPTELSDGEFDKLIEQILKQNGQPKSGNGGGNPIKLTPEQAKKLADALAKQKNFIDGKVKKEGIGSDTAKEVSAVSDAGVTQKNVGATPKKDGSGDVGGCKAIVIRKLTKNLIDSDPFGVFSRGNNSQNIENINNGIILGNLLGRRLQVRNEQRSTVFTRLKTGNIDKRLISSLGYGAEQIFSQIKIDAFNPVMLHISVDASGSMSGSKWNRTQTAVVAIAKAASMVQNLNVVIDYRSTTNASGESSPLVIVAYDSRVDKFVKIRELFPYIDANSATPEGLCFEAIEGIIEENKKIDTYFINFSDGEPCFGTHNFSYSGRMAIEHTRKQVKRMRSKGINVMGYFIGNGHSLDSDFVEMYGNNSQAIDVTEVVPLAISLNKMFTKKSANE